MTHGVDDGKEDKDMGLAIIPGSRLATMILWMKKHPQSTAAQIASGNDLNDSWVEQQLRMLRMAEVVVEHPLEKGMGYSVKNITMMHPD
jgi:hypothetical protein